MKNKYPKPYLRGQTYWIKYTVSGKSHYITLQTKDPDIARIKSKEVMEKVVYGVHPKKLKKATLADAVHTYLKNTANRKVKVSLDRERITLNQLQTLINRKFSLVSTIDENDIELFIKKRLEAVKKTTINNDIIRVKTFFNWCIKQRLIKENPCADFKKFRTETNPPNYLSKDQLKGFIEAAKATHIYPMVCTALYAGLRRSELVHLEWQDIDFQNNVIFVVNKDEKSTKNKKFRSIPIADQLKEVLWPIRRENGPVFLNIYNKPYNTYPRKTMAQITRKANLKDIGFHTLRHTFASNLVMSGVDLNTIKELMGHADIQTTMIYLHLDDSHKQKAIQKLTFDH